jgi:hypothetical protein
MYVLKSEYKVDETASSSVDAIAYTQKDKCVCIAKAALVFRSMLAFFERSAGPRTCDDDAVFVSEELPCEGLAQALGATCSVQ